MSTHPLRDELHRVFGRDGLELGLFYRHAPALRFELSLGGSYVEMFTQAYDRAREILDAAFAETGELTVVLSQFGGGPPLAHLSGFRSVRRCGVELPRGFEAWTEPTDDEWHPERAFLAFRCGRGEVNGLLWGALAADLGIRPRLECRVHLADAERGILAHPYDDRGMDLIGPNHALLRELYTRFNPWLLDYDCERIDGFFAEAG
jgi:Domain of unknown function (DUF3885)